MNEQKTQEYADYVNGQRDVFRMYATALREIPIQNAQGWNRCDTDTEHVLHVWSEGKSYDIRVPRDEFLPKVQATTFGVEKIGERQR